MPSGGAAALESRERAEKRLLKDVRRLELATDEASHAGADESLEPLSLPLAQRIERAPVAGSGSIEERMSVFVPANGGKRECWQAAPGSAKLLLMKAVIPNVPPEILAWRKRTGAHRWDEMWDGVLHMPPMPNRQHQELESGMERFLYFNWARPNKAKVYHQINLASPGGWPERDYRIPDLVLLSRERFHIDHNEYFEGAPDVVVEIRSPGDETYEKLEFYAKLGVPEVWIVDRDTRRPEILVLQDGGYVAAPPGDDGWIESRQTGIQLKAAQDGRLAMRVGRDESTRADLPEE